MLTIEQTQALFASRGLRCTRQRLAVYHALASSREHPTADDLYRHCVAHCGCKAEGLSLATVYNTLEALCAAGLAHKLAGAGENGSARYDALGGGGQDPHLHLRDPRTGRVQDVPDDLGQKILDHIPQSILRELEAKLGFKVEQVQIELVGRYDEQAVSA